MRNEHSHDPLEPTVELNHADDANEPAPMSSSFATEDLARVAGLLAAGPQDDGEPHPAQLPRSIGRYRIVRLLGEGGMGVVYEAEQDHPRRAVALKVIRPLFVTRQTVRRFTHEAEVLGRLEHPGIARVYDAGSAKPDDDADAPTQPYFAMELVRDGIPLTSYAEAKGLDTRARMDLLVRVCDAVQYAHQHGVIHRDLKPANILVDETGQPKILDFGVARLMAGDTPLAASPATMQTQTGQVIGTLAYMSPEQASGDARGLDTRSDVYALGVIAYQLLANKLPYSLDGQSLPEVVRLIREQEPSRLSSINRSFRGDIETIIAKALSKERDRRYASAGELAADVRRYLAHQPITARPASTMYHLRKFARRNKVLVGGIVAVFLALIGGVIGTSLMAVRAKVAEGKSTEQAISAKRRLSDQISREGILRLDAGDPAAALVRFVQALRIDERELPDADRARGDRIRIAMALARAPRPVEPGPDVPSQRLRPAQGIPDRYIFVSPTADGRYKELLVRDFKTNHTLATIQTLEPVISSLMSLDGRWVATGGLAGDATIWDAHTGKRLVALHQREPKAEEDPPLSGNVGILNFNRDGSEVLTVDGGYDKFHNPVRAWDLKSGTAVTPPLTHLVGVNGAAFSPDGQHIVTACNDSLARIWSRSDGHLEQSFRHLYGRVTIVAYSNDGARLATATESDHTVRIWDVQTARPASRDMLHSGPVQQIQFSSDGSRLLTLTDRRAVRVWDARTGDPLTSSITLPFSVTTAQFTADDPRLLVFTTWVGELTGIQFWDTLSEQPSGLLMRHMDQVMISTFSPDGTRIATGSNDLSSRIWDSKTGRPIGLPISHSLWSNDLGWGPSVHWVNFSNDGRLLLVCADSEVRIWDVESSRPVSKFGGGMVIQLTDEKPTTEWESEAQYRDRVGNHPVGNFSPDGRSVVTATPPATDVWIWDAQTGKTIDPPLKHDAAPWLAWWSPDGSRILTVVATSAQLWDAKTHQPIGGPLRHDGQPFGFPAFSPDGRLVATCGEDHKLRLWSAATGESVLTPIDGPTNITLRQSFNADGSRLVANGPAAFVTVYDTATGRPTLRFVPDSGTEQARISPDGRLIVTTLDKTARVWDARSGVPVGATFRHDQAITSVMFNAASNQLLTSSGDGTARAWNIIPESMPLNDLIAVTELLSVVRVDESGDESNLQPEDHAKRWETLRQKYPERFALPAASSAATRPSVQQLASYREALNELPTIEKNAWPRAYLVQREVYCDHPDEAIAAAQAWLNSRRSPENPTDQNEVKVRLHLAHAYVLAGRFDDAKALLEHCRSWIFNKDAINKPFPVAMLEGIEELQRRGIDRPAMEQMKRLLTSSPPASTQPDPSAKP